MAEWRNTIFKQMVYFQNYKYVQAHLPIDVPYVILKGSSAAKYYPRPEYRAMGDIDIITRREEYAAACDAMLKDGWHETTDESEHERNRHRSFAKKGIIVEIHAFFASMNNVEKAKAFDDLIISSITEDHILPDLINGLVLIEHVNQHMEQEIGLRQIIDWMMFVDRCLTDDKWPEFEIMAKQTGLKELSVMTTRMCEIYLGLQRHQWCAGADEKLCRDLMEYVMKCGNFGVKLNQTDALCVSVLYQMRHPLKVIRALQEKGCEAWAAAKNPILRPFAWIVEGSQRMRRSKNALEAYRKA